MTTELWFDLIENTTVEDIIMQKQRPVVTVPSTSTLGEALATLSRENILSAPVVTGGTVRGLVDVIDIAGYVLKCWKEESPYFDTKHFPAGSVFNVPITEVLNYSSFNPMVTVWSTTSVKELIDIFSSPRTFNRLHRALVLGNDGNVWNIVSQSDIVKFVSDNLAFLPKDMVVKFSKHNVIRLI